MWRLHVGGLVLSSAVNSHKQHAKPVIITPQSTILVDAERENYAKHKPYGFILFGRHCDNPEQVKKLCQDLRDAVGFDCAILIDQEGGRVARMRRPHWPEFPPAAQLGDGTYDNYQSLGAMLAVEGVNVDCAPCLDVVPDGGQCDAIGDRCFSHDPNMAGQWGIDACRGLLDAGVTPVIKHMPGHGRAAEDSHYFLPVVKASADELHNDLIPFQMVAQWDTDQRVQGMTAHVIFEAWDKDHPATLSPIIIKDVIRGLIGFKGLLYSDDLAMKALDRYGSLVDRVKLSLAAGVNIALPCNTSMDETIAILEAL